MKISGYSRRYSRKRWLDRYTIEDSISNIQLRLPEIPAEPFIGSEKANVSGIVYKRVDDGKKVYADYAIIPIPNQKGICKIEEFLMDEQNHALKTYAMTDIHNEVERNLYLQEHEFTKIKNRVMYMVIDDSIIKQLNGKKGLKQMQAAVDVFKRAVGFQEIKKRILEQGGADAKFVYEQGKSKTPRLYGYIGTIKETHKELKIEYNGNDRRARSINEAIRKNMISTNEKLAEEYYEGENR